MAGRKLQISNSKIQRLGRLRADARALQRPINEAVAEFKHAAPRTEVAATGDGRTPRPGGVESRTTCRDLNRRGNVRHGLGFVLRERSGGTERNWARLRAGMAVGVWHLETAQRLSPHPGPLPLNGGRGSDFCGVLAEVSAARQSRGAGLHPAASGQSVSRPAGNGAREMDRGWCQDGFVGGWWHLNCFLRVDLFESDVVLFRRDHGFAT
jgi:hypothetical protein